VPDSDPAPPPPVPPARASWRRVRVYLWSILVVLAIYFYGAACMVRQQPKRLTEKILAQLPFPSSLGKVTWLNPQTLEFRDVKLGNFFYAESIVVKASVYQLLRHHITELDVHGGEIFTQPLNDVLRRGGSNQAEAGLDWTITKLVISRGTLMLDNLAPGMPSIPVRLGVSQPIVLNYIKFNRPDASPSMTRERTLDIENVNIVSPFDPLAPVLSFPLIRVSFTYTELWHHHLREVDLVHPIIHLGEDLFWFSQELKKERVKTTDQGVSAPWQIGHFQVRYGQLAVNVFGQPRVQFPFFFDTDVNSIRLDQLDKISAKSVVAIRRLDQDYPDYKIQIVNLHGKLEFSIPPTDANANNVVPTVYIDELAWNGIAATKVWSSVTFDPNGIYGRLGGDCENGYLKGNFEVYYTKGFQWNADFFADKIESQPIAQKLAGKYFSLTGTLDGKIAVQGKATKILSCKGALDMAHPGMLEIHSLDSLMKEVPQTLQQKAMQIALQAFRSYPYQTGALRLDYQPSGGAATLKLAGPQGKREFSVYLHPYETSKVAKSEDSR
jgi:hypothetical protein